jgi:hypothetical protein
MVALLAAAPDFGQGLGQGLPGLGRNLPAPPGAAPHPAVLR